MRRLLLVLILLGQAGVAHARVAATFGSGYPYRVRQRILELLRAASGAPVQELPAQAPAPAGALVLVFGDTAAGRRLERARGYLQGAENSLYKKLDTLARWLGPAGGWVRDCLRPLEREPDLRAIVRGR